MKVSSSTMMAGLIATFLLDEAANCRPRWIYLVEMVGRSENGAPW
jgi:hypothetical protein